MSHNAKQLFNTANQLANDGSPQGLTRAEEIAATLLQHYPDDASSLALAGKVQANKRYYGVARALILQALQALPKDDKYDLSRAEYLNNLGFCCRFLNRHEEGREAYRKALAYAGEREMDIYGNMAALYVARGEAEEGLGYVQKAVDANPKDENALNNKSILLLELGKWEEGFGLYDNRMVLKEEGKRWKEYPGNPPLWNGKPGQTVIVYGEQGIGDEVMFASCLGDIARDCNVIFDCNERLYDLFKASFPDLIIYGTKRQDAATLEWPKEYTIDAMIPVGSLPRFYRKRNEDFPKQPYIMAPKGEADKVAERIAALGPRPKIGISWVGGSVDTHCWERHIQLPMWLPILGLDADFISLQYDEKAGAEVDALKQMTGATIHHWPDVVCDKNYAATAGLLEHLDLVISVPQSVVHLAGSMGKPVWQLTPRRAMWQMGVYGEDMPWYGSVKSYWQDEPGAWEPVLKQVKEDLCKFLQTV
jgi:tetratricopeptide (TPR) repeat protein